LTTARAEHLRSAMKDSFHWRMLARPAELIDLDATILMSLALGTGASEEMLAKAMRSEIPLVDAPLRIAASLRRDQDFSVN
ncbi:MAG: hypothetical protein ACAH11_03890, partial [Sphingomonas sp.]